MIELKGEVNADKLFALLVKRVGELGYGVTKEYSINEIVAIIPKKDSGITNSSTYHYSITSMFSGQKERDYFIFENPGLRQEFTELANNQYRNSHEWKIYGDELVRINPTYVNPSNELFSYSDVKSIRILPMSESDPAFSEKSMEEVQQWFRDVLPYREYNFTKGLNSERGTLVLFQYKAHIIAAAILEEKIIFKEKLGGVYKGAYRFVPSSIATFQPIDSSTMKSVWNDFKGFNQSYQNLDVDKYIDFVGLINKTVSYTLDTGDESLYQDAIERTEIDSSIEPGACDEPRDPLRITSTGPSKRWHRNSIISKRAIVLANYMCEYDENHSLFVSKTTGQNYVEAHHLIPMEFQPEFKRSLDVEANIISLCPLCHKKVHHASSKEVKPIIRKLYKGRKGRLRKCEINITIDKLLEYYR